MERLDPFLSQVIPLSTMDSWSTLAVFFFTSLLCLALASLLKSRKRKNKPPPGPPPVPILGNLILFTKGLAGLTEALKEFRERYGPIVTLYAGSHPCIFITDGEVAHKLLVQEHSVAFADRPSLDQMLKLSSANQHNISSAPFGPLWRILRQNILIEVLNASRVKTYSAGREWAVRQLVNELRKEVDASGSAVVTPLSSFELAFFGLISYISFGEKLDEKIIRSIQQSLRDYNSFLSNNHEPSKFFSKLVDILLRKKWNKFFELHHRRNDILLPLIQACRDKKSSSSDKNFAYVDSLFDLRLPHEGNRKLTQGEVVVLTNEMYIAGIDTTTVALQWTMARLVKHPHMQKRLVEDIKGVETEWITEEDAQKVPYLKAVIKESLRLHPPGHFVLGHRVSEDVQLEKYVIPKGATMTVAMGVINRDEKLWKDAMEFKPERFMPKGDGEGVDSTNSKENVLMAFGVGRRSCPASGLAILHLEYFVANLIWKFEWKAVEGEDDVDMTEEFAFTTPMKNPLRARLFPRRV